MSLESLAAPARKPRPRAGRSFTPALLDIVLIAAFLALAFLLGVFPLKDTDFWWHLRTGDLIRQSGQVPRTDLYTYTVPDHRWVDLHWAFQVALGWGYAHGGVVALNLAKCAITTMAVLLLVTARRREWPVWVMLLAWLPALLVLGGRMYIRPETLTLLFLAIDLAILFRWERYPALALLLPVVQVLWVNTQGLFVLGPILVGFALLDAALRRGAFAPGRKRWWQVIGLATLLTGLACLVNPYGISGAFYPLELARTMGNPLFARVIAELMPIPLFIERNAGWRSLPLQLHMATMLLGALSFLIPMVWLAVQRLRTPAAIEAAPAADKPVKRRKKRGKAGAEPPEAPWRLSPLRLLLFVSFSVLSWRATRNSHQFAAIVGTLTAWNFAEWAAALKLRRGGAQAKDAPASGVFPRLVTLGAIAVVFLLVASGRFYAWAGEGRTIGLGEEPLWFPHAAVKFAGQPDMPPRLLSFHDGYAALYEYHNGPKRKVFIDARLEVVGAEMYDRYIKLGRRIRNDEPGWTADLDAAERPAVLVGHATDAVLGATLLANPAWRCVWFDPMVAVYLHRSYAGAVAKHGVDLGARHFARDPATEPHGLPAVRASAESLWKYANALQSRGRPDLGRPLVLLGRDYAARLREANPDDLDGWKLLGKLEMTRDPIILGGEAVRRYRQSFDPVHDLSVVRATYELRRARDLAPRDFLTLLLLESLFEGRGMDEAAAPLLAGLARLAPINAEQAAQVRDAAAQLPLLEQRLGPAPPAAGSWKNRNELETTVAGLLAHGRVRSAAEFLEKAYPGEPRPPWEVADRLATLWLHLGEAARARTVWERALEPPRPGLRAARLAVTHLVEGDFEAARRLYHEALAAEDDLFEARYGLAVLEQDAGRAEEAYAAARRAQTIAPGEVERSAAGVIVALVRPYAEAPAGPPALPPRNRNRPPEDPIRR